MLIRMMYKPLTSNLTLPLYLSTLQNHVHLVGGPCYDLVDHLGQLCTTNKPATANLTNISRFDLFFSAGIPRFPVQNRLSNTVKVIECVSVYVCMRLGEKDRFRPAIPDCFIHQRLDKENV